MPYILALDQGTTSSRAIIFDAQAQMVAMAQQEFEQHYPQPAWVEHDANEIWQTQLETARQAIAQAGISPTQIAGIGITNQRETTVLWDKTTGKPLHNAIVWQDRRTAARCEQLKAEGWEAYIRENTGLVADAYFSGTKAAWLLGWLRENRPEIPLENICFGTIDTWLMWKLTNGRTHATDFSNASRTLLYNIRTLAWDSTLCTELGVPLGILPKVLPSSGHFGVVDAQWFGAEIPILGVAGDQQAALFGQACFEAGEAKNTYGTGCFMLMNTGETPVQSHHGLLTTIAWGIDGKVEYALEGSVFIAGAAVQWLRDGLKLIDESRDSEYFGEKVPDSDGVYVVPAFTGLGAPYWDMYARGAIFGITRGTTANHLIRATLEAIAYQSCDVLEAMAQDAGLRLSALRVDGGAAANDLLMQFQADMLNTSVERPANTESTALGAAYLAGIAAGIWTQAAIRAKRVIARTFSPNMPSTERETRYAGWKDAVRRTLG